jgi:hypothetical protein
MAKIHPSRFAPAISKFNTWHVDAPEGTTIDDVQKEDYWTHVGTRLRRNDIIVVSPEDGSWWAELLVRDAGAMFATVEILREKHFDDVVEREVDLGDIKIGWGGRAHKFRFMRVNGTGAPDILEKGFDTREMAYAAAVKWTREHRRAA